MKVISDCKTGKDLLQVTESFRIVGSPGTNYSLSDIEALVISLVIAADGKAVVSLISNSGGNLYAVALDVIEKTGTIYSLES